MSNAWPKTNVNKVPRWVFLYVGNKTFDFSRKNSDFLPEIGIFVHFGRHIWCPVVGLVGGCGARAVPRKTHIYFIITNMKKNVNFETTSSFVLGSQHKDLKKTVNIEMISSSVYQVHKDWPPVYYNSIHNQQIKVSRIWRFAYLISKRTISRFLQRKWWCWWWKSRGKCNDFVKTSLKWGN